MYNDNHRYFLQHMLSHSCIYMEEALKFHQMCKTDDSLTLEDLKMHVLAINKEITTHDLKLVTSKCEVTGDSYLILINTSNDEVSKLQIEYTPIQLEYLQAIVKEILSSEEKRVRPIFCLNLSSSLTASFTRHSAETSLQNWADNGYFIIKNEYVHLGPRYISEFTSYLYSSYKDFISTCVLCSEILVLGSTCANCKKQIHKHCLKRFLSTRKKCPDCKKPWEEAEALTSQSSNAETTVESSSMETSQSDEED